MTADVVAFAPRRPAILELPLDFVELRLSEDCSIQMTLYDEDRNPVAALEFTLSTKPQDFDLDRLREAWSRWREQQSKVVA